MNPDPTSLDRLHDIIAPPSVPWWPPAPGWYGLFGLLLFLALVGAARFFLSWQHNRYRREALAEWSRLAALLDDAGTRLAALTGLAVLLKRAAVTAFPRTETAALTGPAWLAFLDHTAGKPGFASETGSLLEHAAYGSIDAARIDASRAREAAALVRRWLTHHRVEVKSHGGVAGC